MDNERYEVVGDLAAPKHLVNVTEIYRNYAQRGLQEGESDIFLNWGVICKDTGATMAIMGGGAGHAAAQAFKDYCEANY